MSLLELVIKRIVESGLFKTVDGIEALASIAQAPGARPACYVVPASDDYNAVQEGAGLIQIEMIEAFDVVIVVDGAVQTGRRQADLKALADELRDKCLLGWTPDGTRWRPFVPVAGRLLGLEGGRASWLTRYRTAQWLRKQGN